MFGVIPTSFPLVPREPQGCRFGVIPHTPPFRGEWGMTTANPGRAPLQEGE